MSLEKEGKKLCTESEIWKDLAASKTKTWNVFCFKFGFSQKCIVLNLIFSFSYGADSSKGIKRAYKFLSVVDKVDIKKIT